MLGETTTLASDAILEATDDVWTTRTGISHIESEVFCPIAISPVDEGTQLLVNLQHVADSRSREYNSPSKTTTTAVATLTPASPGILWLTRPPDPTRLLPGMAQHLGLDTTPDPQHGQVPPRGNHAALAGPPGVADRDAPDGQAQADLRPVD